MLRAFLSPYGVSLQDLPEEASLCQVEEICPPRLRVAGHTLVLIPAHAHEATYRKLDLFTYEREEPDASA